MFKKFADVLVRQVLVLVSWKKLKFKNKIHLVFYEQSMI